MIAPHRKEAAAAARNAATAAATTAATSVVGITSAAEAVGPDSTQADGSCGDAGAAQTSSLFVEIPILFVHPITTVECTIGRNHL